MAAPIRGEHYAIPTECFGLRGGCGGNESVGVSSRIVYDTYSNNSLTIVRDPRLRNCERSDSRSDKSIHAGTSRAMVVSVPVMLPFTREELLHA